MFVDWILSFGLYTSSVFLVVMFLVISYNLFLKKIVSFNDNPEFLTVKDVPGVFSLPIFGTGWIYTFFGNYKLSKIHEAYSDMFKKYGNIIKEEALFNIPVVSIVSRRDIELVLKQQSKYPLRPPTEVVSYYRRTRPDRYTNLGIVNEQGEIWHQLRVSLTPELMSPKTIAQFFPECLRIVDDFIVCIKNQRINETHTVTHFEDFCSRMGLESSCTLILGRRMGFLDDILDKKVQVLASAVQDLFCAMRDTFYGLPFWKIYPTKAYRKFVESEEMIYSIISEMVDSALAEKRDTCEVEAVQSVFMSMLQAPQVSLCDKKAAIIDFIAAGIQTFGNTLIFILYLIATYPDCQQRLYDELKELTETCGGTINSTVITKAVFLRCCILEAYRLLPTSNMLARILEKDIDLSGYSLKSGTVILCHVGLACLNNSNFKHASEFRPERWLNEEKTEAQNAATYLVIPFGIGRRMCPGKRFVEQELQLTLAKMILDFEIVFPQKLTTTFEFLMAPKGPISIILKDRL